MTAEIDAFLQDVPSEKRTALQHLREVIQAAAPDAVEGISYGTAAFRYRGRPLVSYGAAKAHCAFYCMSPAVLDDYRADLAAFSTSKGTIRFTPEAPLPDDLVARIVRDRMAETDAAAAKQR